MKLVENLRTAYGKRIKQLPWMTAETKKVALEKLAAFRPKIGYPDKWKDYTALEVRAGDAFGNAGSRARVQLERRPRSTTRQADRSRASGS